jgi:membrane-bound lytic murein transglycosylase D
MKRILSIVTLGLFAASAALAARSDFPQPRALEPDVTFWKRIYSEVGTDGGLIHDTHDLSLVYEVVKFPNRNATDRHTEDRKRYYQGILRTLAAGKRSGLSRDEQRVLALFGRDVSSARLRLASERLRFQLGQADKFRAGVIRSGAYLDHIQAILRDMNLPAEIAHLPHVESSFTPDIYSRIGAAGLWQFTSATGRRFMRVDQVVDERLDPYRASLAAARLLEQNYRVTGSWPLAITAYNHGAAGMRRAAQQLGTKDIARIVRQYRSSTFGFASRNFYVEFLAADHVASNYRTYFGELDLHDPIDFETVTLPHFTRARDLAKAFDIDIASLEKANPALRPGVWRNTSLVPKGYGLRVPRGTLDRPAEQILASVPSADAQATRTTSGAYVVRRGDTLSTIARRHGLTTKRLAAMNGIRRANSIRIGQRLRVPGGREAILPMPAETPREVRVAAAPVPQEETRPVVRAEAPAPPPEAASVAPAQSGPRDETASIAASETVTQTYTVRRGDNLTRIARAHGLSVAELSALNGLGNRHRIQAGQKLTIVKPASTDDGEVPVAETKPIPTPVAQPTSTPTPATPAVAIAASTPAETTARAPNPVPTPRAIAAPTPAPAPSEVASAAGKPIVGPNPELSETWDPNDESATEPSPGLLADPSDYTVASDRTVVVQANETLGHYAEWLGVRASRLRQLNGMRYSEPVVVQQKIRLDFSNVPPADFERIRTEYHRQLQEAFFAEWEIEGTSVHKVGPGDSIWSLSTRRFAVPIWLLRQYNPDVDLDALSAGTQITVPKLRQRNAETSARETFDRAAAAG